MDTEMTTAYAAPCHTFLLKFDGKQQYTKEVQLKTYKAEDDSMSNPFNDIPVNKTICLNRVPPWADPDSLQNLMVRLSGGLLVKVGNVISLIFLLIWASRERAIWTLGELIVSLFQIVRIFKHKPNLALNE